ncbi:YraN family protein [bacterium]|nr:YraN family protein [bacterium]MBU0900188.1 YraN family protein [bacterium]MBU1153477.1 YraN family protein [bacterium]MBU1782109.1 YraN family protein [bacterium]MBU2599033.1 YraN family protein [bacterium]
MSSKDLGKKGEEIAVKYLKKQGYKIIELNYQTKLGEIDIIALDKNILVFIEVKSRISPRYGPPIEAVNQRKRLQVEKVAKVYLTQKNLWHLNCRFDIVSIILTAQKPNIFLAKDAFWVESEK